MSSRHASSAASRITVDTWLERDDLDGELVNGLLVEDEVTTKAHEAFVMWLAAAFYAYLAPRGGLAFTSNWKVAISGDRGRKPDVSAWWPGPPLSSGGKHAGHIPPDVVVEVITHTPRDEYRDRVEKRAEYASIRVKQYWVVDTETRTIEILQRARNGRYAPLLTVTRGRHEIPGWGGFVLDVDAVWAELERVEARLGKD